MGVAFVRELDERRTRLFGRDAELHDDARGFGATRGIRIASDHRDDLIEERPATMPRDRAKRRSADERARAVERDGQHFVVGRLRAFAEELRREARAPIVGRTKLREERGARVGVEALRLDRVEVERPLVDRAPQRVAIRTAAPRACTRSHRAIA